MSLFSKSKKIKKEIKLKKNKIVQLVICVVSTLVVFVALLYLKNILVSPENTKTVLVATKEIERNQLITEENINELFKEDERKVSSISSETIKSKSDLINKVTKNEVITGNTITPNGLLDKDSLLSKIKEPVEYSLIGSDIGQVVGGTLREGDIVDIGVINETTKDYQETKKFAYISTVLGANGKKLEKDSIEAAVCINVITSREDRNKIENDLAKGKIKISRVQDLSSIS